MANDQLNVHEEIGYPVHEPICIPQIHHVSKPEFLQCNIKHPLEIFSGDIWMEILRRTALEDLLNILNCHIYFRDLWKGVDNGRLWTGLLQNHALPCVLNYVASVNDFCSLRLVSKNFASKIDSFLENIEWWREFCFPCLHAKAYLDLSKHIKVDVHGRANMDLLLEDMQRYTDAKVIAHAVKCHYLERWINVIPFFELRGNEIGDLCLSAGSTSVVRGQAMGPLEYLRFIKRVLRCVPNLKNLCLTSDGVNVPDLGENYVLWELKVIVENHHDIFPPLKNLINLNITNEDGHDPRPNNVMYIVHKSILKAYCRQLRHLGVYGMNLQYKCYNMAALTHLKVEVFSRSFFKTVSTLGSPLKQLCIGIYDHTISMIELFRLVEKFKFTLVELSVHADVMSFLPALHLPKLKKLFIEWVFVYDIESYNFIFGLTSLKELTMGIKCFPTMLYGGNNMPSTQEPNLDILKPDGTIRNTSEFQKYALSKGLVNLDTMCIFKY